MSNFGTETLYLLEKAACGRFFLKRVPKLMEFWNTLKFLSLSIVINDTALLIKFQPFSDIIFSLENVQTPPNTRLTFCRPVLAVRVTCNVRRKFLGVKII